MIPHLRAFLTRKPKPLPRAWTNIALGVALIVSAFVESFFFNMPAVIAGLVALFGGGAVLIVHHFGSGRAPGA